MFLVLDMEIGDGLEELSTISESVKASLQAKTSALSMPKSSSSGWFGSGVDDSSLDIDDLVCDEELDEPDYEHDIDSTKESGKRQYNIDKHDSKFLDIEILCPAADTDFESQTPARVQSPESRLQSNHKFPALLPVREHQERWRDVFSKSKAQKRLESVPEIEIEGRNDNILDVREEQLMRAMKENNRLLEEIELLRRDPEIMDRKRSSSEDSKRAKEQLVHLQVKLQEKETHIKDMEAFGILQMGIHL